MTVKSLHKRAYRQNPRVMEHNQLKMVVNSSGKVTALVLNLPFFVKSM